MKGAGIVCLVVFLGGTIFFNGGFSQRAPGPTASPPLRLIQEITLPGVQGRIDHFTVDAERERLIFSALGNNTVEMVSLFAGKVVHSITGLDGPQGVVYVPAHDRIVVANSGDGKVRVYDGTSFDLVKILDFGKDTDNVRYDPLAQKIYVGYGEDETGAIGIIDATSYERLSGDYKLGGGHPESFQLEASGPKIFVNDPDGGSVTLTIDRNTRAVSKWQLNGNRFNFPMALDEADHRLFVGTRRPSKLIVLNTQTAAIVTTLTCAGDTDDMYYDPHSKRVYVIGGEGMISVFQQKDPDHYELKANIPSSIGARTGFYFPTHDTDRLYVAVPSHSGQSAELWVYEVQD
jgi:DNA-binding beta-propeller fold protein YncE